MARFKGLVGDFRRGRTAPTHPGSQHERRARLLFIIDELDIGGTEQQILELVKRLDRDRYVPWSAASGPDASPRRSSPPACPCSRSASGRSSTRASSRSSWRSCAGSASTSPRRTSSRRTRGEARGDHRRRPDHRHLGAERRHVGGALQAGHRRWLDRCTYRTTGNSQAVKDYLVKKGLAPDKVHVIYNGVDPSRFEGEPVTPGVTRSEFGIPPHHSVVGLLARLEPQKDPRTFLRAAAILVKKLPTVSCLVIGGGSLQAELEREAQALGLGDRVTFTGPRRDVARLLAACDISVLSSVKEGMSNTIMESMAAGKPMVATRVGGNAELIAEGETGFLVPPRDPAALADAVQRILEDPALAKAMGHQARVRIAQRFSVEAMVKSTERLYGEALASPRSGRAARGQVPGAPDGRIALVASQFPRNVDAYFVREIAGLAARGLRFRIFSLRAFGGKVVHASARPLLKDTVYAAFLLSWPVLRANARFAVRRPARYFGALARLIAGPVGNPRALALNLAIFPKSVYFAEQVEAEGIRHIHANWASHPAMSAWVMSRLTGASWSFAGHASDIYLHRTMLREKIQAAKFVVTCTRHNKDYLADVGGGAARQQDRGELPRRRSGPVQARPSAGRRHLPDPDGGDIAGVQGPPGPHRGLPPSHRPRDQLRLHDRRRRTGPPEPGEADRPGRARDSHEDHGLPESGRPHPALPARRASWCCPRCPRRISASRTSCSRPWPSRRP